MRRLRKLPRRDTINGGGHTPSKLKTSCILEDSGNNTSRRYRMFERTTEQQRKERYICCSMLITAEMRRSDETVGVVFISLGSEKKTKLQHNVMMKFHWNSILDILIRSDGVSSIEELRCEVYFDVGTTPDSQLTPPFQLHGNVEEPLQRRRSLVGQSTTSGVISIAKFVP